jgi:hypothetical protein
MKKGRKPKSKNNLQNLEKGKFIFKRRFIDDYRET